MTKNLVVVIAVLSMVGGAWFHGDHHGTVTCEAKHTEAENDLRKELDKLKAEGVGIVTDAERKTRDERRESDEELTAQKETDTGLREYLDARVPDPALDYAFGVRNNGQ